MTVADLWKLREAESTERAWNALVAFIANGDKLGDVLAGIGAVYGLHARVECERRIAALIEEEPRV